MKKRAKARLFFRKIYMFNKSNIFSNFVQLILLLIIFTVVLILKIKKVIKIEVFNSIVDTGLLFAIVIVIVTSILVSIIGYSFTKKHSEDIRINYQNIDILNKYESSNINKEDNIKYPIIDVIYSLGKKIEIVDEENKFYDIPQEIYSQQSEIFKAYKGNVIFNSICVRVDRIDEQEEEIVLNTSRTYYYNSSITNRAADFVLENGCTIRDIYEPGPYIKSLENSKMSNHLGFNGFVITNDGYVPFIVRSKNVSIGKDTLANSIGASLKAKYALDCNGKKKEYPLGESIFNEIIDELNLGCLEIEYDTLGFTPADLEKNIICFYRDIVELGKPQFLFYCKINLSKEQIDEAIKAKAIETNKDTRKVQKDGDMAIFLNKEEILNGVSMNYSTIKLLSTNKEYPIMPSAAACVSIFKDFIKNGKINF